MEDRMRILLCEDDENLGMLLREYLQAKGYNADLFVDGEAGYKAFLKGKYDICVLDVMMPKKDGFTLAQEIRNVNSEVPIIFLTAKSLNRILYKLNLQISHFFCNFAAFYSLTGTLCFNVSGNKR